MTTIKLGYEIGTGKEIKIPLAHMIVTGLSQKSGPTNKTTGAHAMELVNIEVVRKDSAGRFFPELQKRIESLLGNHDATQEEKENLYNHIIMEMVN